MFFLEDYRVRRRHTSHAKPTRKGCSNLPVVGGIARTGHEEKDGNQGMFILYNWHLDKCISCSPKFASKSLNYKTAPHSDLNHSLAVLGGPGLHHRRFILHEALQVLCPEVEKGSVRTQELFRLAEVQN